MTFRTVFICIGANAHGKMAIRFLGAERFRFLYFDDRGAYKLPEKPDLAGSLAMFFKKNLSILKSKEEKNDVGEIFISESKWTWRRVKNEEWSMKSCILKEYKKCWMKEMVPVEPQPIWYSRDWASRKRNRKENKVFSMQVYPVRLEHFSFVCINAIFFPPLTTSQSLRFIQIASVKLMILFTAKMRDV